MCKHTFTILYDLNSFKRNISQRSVKNTKTGEEKKFSFDHRRGVANPRKMKDSYF